MWIDFRVLPDQFWLTAVKGYLDRRRLIGTRVKVTGPTYVEVEVRARVRAKTGVVKTELKQRVIDALNEFLDPLHGGPQRTGWPFGRDVYRSEVLQVIDETPGVDCVLSLELVAKGYDLRLMVASDSNAEDAIIRQFKMEFDSKKKECAVLVVRATSHSDRWTLAGFDDAGEFRTVVIDDPNHELSKELKKEPINKSRIIELATSSLGRTLAKRVQQEGNIPLAKTELTVAGLHRIEVEF